MPSRGLLISWAAPSASCARAAYFSYSASCAWNCSFLFVQFSFFVEAAEQFFLGKIAFAFALASEVLGLVEFFLKALDFVVMQAPDDEQNHQRQDQGRHVQLAK